MLKVGSKWISKQLTQNSLHTDAQSDVFSETLTCSTSSIMLYDSSNIHSLIWPENEEGLYAKKFLLPLMTKGVEHYIDNIQTQIKILKIGDLILPISINESEYENSYVCSPFSYYITYAASSLDVIKNKWLKTIVRGVFKGVSRLFKGLKLNKVVIVNNWLLPTNLYPKMNPDCIPLITQFVQQEFPNHAILFRSIDPVTNKEQFEMLKQENYQLVAARQIFLTDTTQSQIFETRLFKSDLRLLNSSGYEVVDGTTLTNNELSRILDLYKDLYISKYCNLNPQLNQQYIKLAVDHEILKFKVLKKNGVIDGIAGFFCRNGTMTCPFFGYDKNQPQQIGLYRILSTVLMLEAKERQLLYHQSAGASTYKKVRKAQDHLEYNAVYNRHLSFFRKLPWLLIRSLYNSLGPYYMKKY